MNTTESLFLSYAHTDQATARAVVQSLRTAGISVWWDEDIPRGPRWQSVLEEPLSSCAGFLALLGPQGVSGWVGAEVGDALYRHYRRGEVIPMPIVPVLLPDADSDGNPPEI